MSEQSEQPSEFGLKDGEYHTPYQITVVYDSVYLFESFVGTMTKRAQLINATMPLDVGKIIAACDHPSPEVLLFEGSTPIGDDVAQAFLDWGAEVVHIFQYLSPVPEEDSPVPEKSREKNLQIARFGADDFYDHVSLMDGYMVVYIMEYLLCNYFPYTSRVDPSINRETAKHLFRSLAGGDVLARLTELATSARGHDNVQQLVMKGRTTAEIFESKAAAYIEKGIVFEYEPSGLDGPANGTSTIPEPKCAKIYAISGQDFAAELLMVAPTHPQVVASGAEYVMLYAFEAHSVPAEGCDDGTDHPMSNCLLFPGWRFVVIAVGESASAIGLFGSLSRATNMHVTGDDSLASGWMPVVSAAPLLPFIYPAALADGLGKYYELD